LRKIADFYESHEDFPPLDCGELNIYSVNSPEQAKSCARMLGIFDKEYNGNIIKLSKKFGEMSLKVVFMRENLCKRNVVGTKKVMKRVAAKYEMQEVEEDVVEWDCGTPLMLKDEELKGVANV